ncbi:hypothetical protein BKA70DRAFT_1432057 [Coprinopsis sp. MPI-PUGE-AT-0042]|nr:hypothetical protein BKA70DRAFT_1432057 [Coprinopsis sp. MPI-PUGE-AT-0042]
MPPVTRSASRVPLQTKEPKRKKLPPRQSEKGYLEAARTRELWKARRKKFSTDPLFFAGQTFARTVDPFLDILDLLDNQRKVDLDLALPEHSLTWRHITVPERRKAHQTYVALKSHLSDADSDEAVHCTPAVLGHIGYLLSRGQSKAWSSDLLAAESLIQRRFGSICGEDLAYEKGRLLRPVDQDWENPQIRAAFIEAPEMAMHCAWPAGLYQNLEYNSLDPWEGFLRSSLLIMSDQVARDTFSALTLSDFQSSPPITANTIVYVATLTIAALAGTEMGIRRVFTLLSQHVEREQETHQHKDLLRWWNRQMATRRPQPLYNFGPATGVHSVHRDLPAGGMLTRLMDGH